MARVPLVQVREGKVVLRNRHKSCMSHSPEGASPVVQEVGEVAANLCEDDRQATGNMDCLPYGWKVHTGVGKAGCGFIELPTSYLTRFLMPMTNCRPLS